MLYSRVYNEAMTQEMRIAYQFRDKNALRKIVHELCEELMMIEETDASYFFVASRLQISLALLNSLCERGETVAFIGDVVNF